MKLLLIIIIQFIPMEISPLKFSYALLLSIMKANHSEKRSNSLYKILIISGTICNGYSIYYY